MTVTQGKAIHWKDFFWGWKNYKPYCSTNTSCCCVRTCIPHIAGGLCFQFVPTGMTFPPTAHISLLSLLCPGPPVWKPAVSSRISFLHIHHSATQNLLQLQKNTHPVFFFLIKDHADMLLLRKKGRKKYWAVKTNFLSVFAAEQCQSNEQMEWRSSFWCRSTKSWLSELQLSWQEWNVVSLLFQFIKLKFKIMNLKLFRPNV